MGISQATSCYWGSRGAENKLGAGEVREERDAAEPHAAAGREGVRGEGGGTGAIGRKVSINDSQPQRVRVRGCTCLCPAISQLTFPLPPGCKAMDMP